MLEIVYRALPVVLVFLTDALYAWVWGGARFIPLIEWMPWVSLLALQTLFFFPQRHQWEDAVAARRRVWTSLARDPLTWISLAFLVLLLIPLCNKGLCPGCDYAAIRAGASPRPPMPYLPWCVNIGEHAMSLMWGIPAMIAMLAVRHALVKHGKRMFLEMLAWNGVLLAIYGFILMGIGAKGPYGDPLLNMWKANAKFFSTFGYPNMGGSYFVLMCAISIGIWRQRWNEAGEIAAATAKDPVKPKHLWIRGNYPLVAAVLNFFGALCTLSRAAIIAVCILALIVFIYIFAGIFAGRRRERIRSLKGAAWATVGMLLFLVLVYVFAPEGLSREMNTVSTIGVLDRVSGKSQYHSRVSMAIFKDYPFFGVGFWGYRHLCGSYMTAEERPHLQVEGGAYVHNDYLQFLCEFGAVGTVLIVAMFVFLLMPVIRDRYKSYHQSKFTRPADEKVKTLALYSLPPSVFWTIVGVVMVLIHACGDCPLRSGAVLSALLTSLAAMEGFISNNKDKSVADVNASLDESRRHGHGHHHHHHHHHHHSR